MRDGRVVEDESAPPRLRRTSDLSARRDDVVDLAISGGHAQLNERTHRPSVEGGVRLAERQARHYCRRHVERICDRPIRLAKHRAPAAHSSRDFETELI